MVPFQALAVKLLTQPANTPAMDQTRINQCVETLSMKGCAEVTRIIAALERGETVTEMVELTADEKYATLTELKSIMAIYQARK